MAVGARASPVYSASYAVPVGYDAPLLGYHGDDQVASRPDVKAAALEDGVAAYDDGGASFVQTFLNGLNALSGHTISCSLQYCPVILEPDF